MQNNFIMIDESYLDKVFLRDKWISFLKTDNCIGKYLKEGFYWESDTIEQCIRDNYIKGTNIVDLGAHIGTTSLMMSEFLSENCKIYSFEPIYHDILKKNVFENSLQNKIITYPFGISNSEDTYKIPKINYNVTANFGSVTILQGKKTPNRYYLTKDFQDSPITYTFDEGLHGFYPNKETEEFVLVNGVKYKILNKEALDISELTFIPMRTLDSFQFENVGLIKIDVEDMELFALEGAIELIKKCKPNIVIEIHNINKLVSSNVFKKMQEIGYNISLIKGASHDYLMTTN